nr:reverse transcriptase domain-containing protein [Tanacetum cinerariifolium]
MHSGPRSVVAKAIRSGYYWPTMHKDARNIIKKCDECQTHRLVARNPQQKLMPITSSWPFYKWGIDISGLLKSRGRDTPFSLTYDTEAVIPIEIGMPSLRCVEVNQAENNEGLLLNLYILEERREKAAIREAKNKAKMENYYNAKVRITSFRPGDFVYRNNEASHAKEGRKLGPKWEGLYEVVEALGKGAYKLRNESENILSRTWNVQDLKKCYL